MNYCPDCASVIEEGQAACPRCGRVVGAAPSPVVVAAAPVVSGVAVGGMPSSVRSAGILVLVSCAISFLSLARFFLMSTTIGLGTIAGSLIGQLAWVLWIVIGICLWKGQNWARWVALLLLAWTLMNTMLTLARVGGAVFLGWSFGVVILIAALRICALYLVFVPVESKAWFKKT